MTESRIERPEPKSCQNEQTTTKTKKGGFLEKVVRKEIRKGEIKRADVGAAVMIGLLGAAVEEPLKLMVI